MSNSVTGAGRITPAVADTQVPNSGSVVVRAAARVPSTEAQPPAPPRFPWLSRLSSQLEPSAPQKPPFQAAPVLGDNLDQAV